MSDSPKRRAPLGTLGLGFEFAAAVIGGCLVGLWADRRWATAPWGVVIGAVIGSIAGFYNFLRASLAAFRAADRSRDETRDENHEKAQGE